MRGSGVAGGSERACRERGSWSALAVSEGVGRARALGVAGLGGAQTQGLREETTPGRRYVGRTRGEIPRQRAKEWQAASSTERTNERRGRRTTRDYWGDAQEAGLGKRAAKSPSARTASAAPRSTFSERPFLCPPSLYSILSRRTPSLARDATPMHRGGQVAVRFPLLKPRRLVPMPHRGGAWPEAAGPAPFRRRAGAPRSRQVSKGHSPDHLGWRPSRHRPTS